MNRKTPIIAMIGTTALSFVCGCAHLRSTAREAGARLGWRGTCGKPDYGQMAREARRLALRLEIENAEAELHEEVPLAAWLARFGRLFQALDEALAAEDLWTPEELQELRDQRLGAVRCSTLALLKGAIGTAARAWNGSTTAEEGLHACQALARVLGIAIEAAAWSPGEMDDLRRYRVELDAMEKELMEGIPQEELAVLNELADCQRRFIEVAARSDLWDSGELLNRESAKAWNWGILGYPRDNVAALAEARAKCLRAANESRLRSALRVEGASLADRIWGRFSHAERDRVRHVSPACAFEDLGAFPNMALDEIQQQAWLRVKGHRSGMPAGTFLSGSKGLEPTRRD